MFRGDNVWQPISDSVQKSLYGCSESLIHLQRILI